MCAWQWAFILENQLPLRHTLPSPIVLLFSTDTHCQAVSVLRSQATLLSLANFYHHASAFIGSPSPGLALREAD